MNIDYLNQLKKEGNYTFESIAKISEIPEATVRNIFSGKTEDPRFDTVAAIVHAMGGKLDTYYKKTPAGKHADENMVSMVRELYLERLRDKDEFIAVLKRERKYLWGAMCILIGVFVAAVVVDIAAGGSIGWLRY